MQTEIEILPDWTGAWYRVLQRLKVTYYAQPWLWMNCPCQLFWNWLFMQQIHALAYRTFLLFTVLQSLINTKVHVWHLSYAQIAVLAAYDLIVKCWRWPPFEIEEEILLLKGRKTVFSKPDMPIGSIENMSKPFWPDLLHWNCQRSPATNLQEAAHTHSRTARSPVVKFKLLQFGIDMKTKYIRQAACMGCPWRIGWL